MDSMRNHIEKVAKTLGKYLLKCLPLYGGYEEYSAAVHKLQPKIVNPMYVMNKPNPQDFNGLNHCDCWTLRYKSGSLEPAETYFVDLQLPKVASVALDLLYFLLGSTQIDLKIRHFDYFIRYYHDQLIEYFKTLKYPEDKIATLRFLHMQLLKYC
ncbi:uncharacterized protein LOC111074255 [Drosophila obscura]|uniref:uncharacterized protein LOC111074255 n=1 Tax=Drosophila obscura TaxID=7282 RepID=UPI001BB222C2|nr:uncharacterized protein LOC111074255 [Drosophila obscura]